MAIHEEPIFLTFKSDVNIVRFRAAVPLSVEGHRSMNLPTVGVGNRKGQASIRIWRLVHPLSTITRGAYIHGMVIKQITYEVHHLILLSHPFRPPREKGPWLAISPVLLPPRHRNGSISRASAMRTNGVVQSMMPAATWGRRLAQSGLIRSAVSQA